jgi:hypothetical protein
MTHYVRYRKFRTNRGSGQVDWVDDTGAKHSGFQGPASGNTLSTYIHEVVSEFLSSFDKPEDIVAVIQRNKWTVVYYRAVA